MDMFLRTWIINIVAIGFLGVVTDLLLSESDFRKFTRFVIGIIMLIAIIRPVFHLLHNPPALDSLVLNDLQAMQVENLRRESEEKRIWTQERIIRLFTGNLQDQIEEQVKMIKGYESVDARIEFHEDDDGNLDINALESISLTISDRREGAIENVNVDIISSGNVEDEGKNAQNARENEASVIREHLFEIYNVDKDNIYLMFEEEN